MRPDLRVVFAHEPGHGDCGNERLLLEAFDELRQDRHAARPHKPDVTAYLHDAFPSVVGDLGEMNGVGLLGALTGDAEKECPKRLKDAV